MNLTSTFESMDSLSIYPICSWAIFPVMQKLNHMGIRNSWPYMQLIYATHGHIMIIGFIQDLSQGLSIEVRNWFTPGREKLFYM